MKHLIDDHLDSIKSAMDLCGPGIVKIADEIKRAKNEHRRVWVLGNGGSLAIAQHFAQDLLKMGGVRAQCLNDPSVLTAYANDEGFHNAFKALEVLADVDDVLVVFSCSGASRNYKPIFSWTEKKLRKCVVVGTDGGFVLGPADFRVHIQSDDYKVIETAFNVVADMVVKSVEEECLK